ncbi:MAG: ferredoxin-thioredoxin reductase catalytic domain-containing protein [Candidatus Margulisbacteria bacterium]|nr:ferredoxin-thioredoxin reductase catalytic domain-containing protein [Candidatus Margulisiibacteriota bacterium]
MAKSPSDSEINEAFEKLSKDAEKSGYHLNPDSGFTKDLIRSLLVNQDRYGYQACPCRLAAGKKAEDLDIICPCNYRDADVVEFNACYCGLYVSDKVVKNKLPVKSIPERRPAPEQRKNQNENAKTAQFAYPIWRCQVCGYLCAREKAPDLCPICKVSSERFELFG